MKSLLLLTCAAICISLFTQCGLRDSAKEVKEARNAVEKMAAELTEAIETAEQQKRLTPDEVALKALTALQENDLDALKKTVQPTLSLYLDEDFLDHNKRNVEEWDGEIIEVRFRKDDRTGLPQGVAHFKNIDDGRIMVHILDKMGENWYAMGGAFSFEEMTVEEFQQLDVSME
ncbi:hypothetical protein [Alkalitalea saponilacus]|uniref:Uncharacterized protein n=1 Tax=Alkalitalea saponilacus TaxID=889453 RepID=A0A1T5E827_9BACT|nr:hypothetical protein [Alkalitalea saponilacus]ASB49080.1 hypothetical protein CDL62_07980 [Alkalitalea saponilacus]SKB80157.1 hypothetical protein SAMN03080601_01235 [Alkalitalea saponilacus]